MSTWTMHTWLRICQRISTRDRYMVKIAEIFVHIVCEQSLTSQVIGWVKLRNILKILHLFICLLIKSNLILKWDIFVHIILIWSDIYQTPGPNRCNFHQLIFCAIFNSLSTNLPPRYKIDLKCDLSSSFLGIIPPTGCLILLHPLVFGWKSE